jgi:hypothetical protein
MKRALPERGLCERMAAVRAWIERAGVRADVGRVAPQLFEIGLPRRDIYNR